MFPIKTHVVLVPVQDKGYRENEDKKRCASEKEPDWDEHQGVGLRLLLGREIEKVSNLYGKGL